MRFVLIIVLLCCAKLTGFSQDSLAVQSSTLTFANFMEIVRTHHPVSRQAELTVDRSEALLTAVRGSFDPKAFTDVAQKYFNGDQYYSLINGGIKIPTWFGIELYTGFEQNRGVYLSQQYYTPNPGLAYAGISLPIGQGLIIDKRRADLRKAQLFVQMSEEERKLILNDLLLEAAQAYWDWQVAYAVKNIYSESVELAAIRFNAVKQTAVLGDRPYVDTLEAAIQLQNLQLLAQESDLQEKNTRQMCSVYLWADGFVPVEIGEELGPESGETILIDSATPEFVEELDSLLNTHPEIKQASLKIDQLEIERRLKAENLKPVLNLKYNALNQPVNNNPFANYAVQNYNWGLEFAMPLFLRKERGELRVAKIMIQDANLGLENKRALLLMKAQLALNEWNTTKNQVELYRRTVNDLGSLLNAERQMFSAGESSLFLVNAREISYINAQVKLTELLAKNRKASVKTMHSVASLVD
jgi:outer membrane protein TolC